MRWLICPFFVFVSCATQLNSKDDYLASTLSLASNKPDNALKSFPSREKDGFVTVLEKGWLALLAGKPDTAPLLRLSRDIEEKRTLSVKREAAQFLYKKTEEGYFPAEHEIILLHLITGLSFASEGKRAESCVEAKRASFYLQSPFSLWQEKFDDAALRGWLAALWLYCGSWQDARVDLKVAGTLAGRADLVALAEREAPPKELALIMTGIGPIITIDTPDERHYESIWKELKFRFIEPPESLSLQHGTGVVPIVQIFSSRPWYERHAQRNHVLRDVLDKSDYMMRSTAVMSGAAVGTGLVAAGSVAAGASIAAGGVGIAVLLAHVTRDFQLAGAVAIAGAGLGYSTGSGLLTSGSREIENSTTKLLDRTKNYRYVRFFPSDISIYANTEELSDLVLVSKSGNVVVPKLQLRNEASSSRVSLFFSPFPSLDMDVDVGEVTGSDNGKIHFSLISPSANADGAAVACEVFSALVGKRWTMLNRNSPVKDVAKFIASKNLTLQNKVQGVWLASDDSPCATTEFSGFQFFSGKCSEKKAVVCVRGS